jgi:L-serine dehydratase
MSARLEVMTSSIRIGVEQELKSRGGLIGGNGRKLFAYRDFARSGPTLAKAVAYALAVTEVSASMGKIVATPTAGSSGILPGVLQALAEDYDYSEDQLVEALLVAAGLGRIIAINATLSGAEGGCQAECGSASAMTAAAVTHLAGGSPDQCLHAAAMALKGLLGLICDPVAGLVEVPCSKRNATATANAMICADMALAGIESFIPFDQVVEAMQRVAEKMSPDFRETARGGCAATKAAKDYVESRKQKQGMRIELN